MDQKNNAKIEQRENFRVQGDVQKLQRRSAVESFKFATGSWKAWQKRIVQLSQLPSHAEPVTCERQARLNWLYGLGDLQMRIADDFRQHSAARMQEASESELSNNKYQHSRF